MSQPSWDWPTVHMSHTFICGSKYVRVVARGAGLAEVYEAVREYVGGDMSTLIHVQSLALNGEADSAFLIENINPEVVL